MPTIVGILTFMNRKNSILGLSEPKKAEFLDIFKSFMTSRSVWHQCVFVDTDAYNLQVIWREIVDLLAFCLTCVASRAAFVFCFSSDVLERLCRFLIIAFHIIIEIVRQCF